MRDLIINFFLVLKGIIFLDIILSWISLLIQKEISIPFISDSLRQIYLSLNNLIPLTIAWLNFSPIILIIWINLTEMLLLKLI